MQNSKVLHFQSILRNVSKDSGMSLAMEWRVTKSEETKYKKLYVCWTSWGFVHNDIDDVAFTTYEEADKWLQATMKVIEQCEGIRDSATRKYKESDPKKYEQMMEEAWS